MTVTALGIQNDGRVGAGQDGVLDSAHEVGLWTAAGVLLASALVDSSGFALGEFFYTAVAAVTLMAGESYVLAGCLCFC